MAREYREDAEEAERHWMERRSRRLLRRRHLSKQERCELAEVRAAQASLAEPETTETRQPEAGE